MKWFVIRSIEKIETNPSNINMVWNPVWEFPGSTVVRTPHFHCWRLNLIPGSGTNYFATWCEETTHWKRPWFWERLKVGGAGDDRGWDGWMASLTQWTWVWVGSRSWWWPRKPDMLQSMGSWVGHGWVTELNWTETLCREGKNMEKYPQMLGVY